MVSRCIRTNGGECGEMSSPERRSFHTEHGKGLEFNPGTLGFLGEGTGSLTLCDGEFHTPESFELKNGVLHERYEQLRCIDNENIIMELMERMQEL